jgi:hypothetical protein
MVQEKWRSSGKTALFSYVVSVMRQQNWVGEKFFLNNEMPERTRKNFMEMALSARTSRIFHEIFSCPFVFLVVKKPLSPSFTDALLVSVFFC